MRKFMSTKRSLADSRIAYTLLAAALLALTAALALASYSRRELVSLRADINRSALAECADSLETLRAQELLASTEPMSDSLYASSALYEKRLAQILRFELGFESLGLPDELSLELRRTAVGLRAGEAVDPELSRTFALLASMRCAETAEIAEMLAGLTGFDNEAPSSTAVPNSASMRGGSVNDRFAMACAEKRLESLLTGASGSIRLGWRGDSIGSDTENLRVSFSPFDGSLRELVYIRLGAVSSRYFTDDELCERARSIVCGSGARDSELELRRLEGFGAFRLYEYTGRTGSGRLVLDKEGRLWAMLCEDG